MSTTIESKVVEMKFDNSNFERNVAQSVNSIEHLKKSIDFKDTANSSFKNITEAARGVDVSSVSESVSLLHSGFSALEIAGITAISNITNRLMGMGENIAKAFTLEPVMSGFQEYETKIGAVQTILANTSGKGSTLEDVDDALERLNKYADQTIYNFTEMTKNVGTFTAAGVGLEESVNAIQGIANLAAVSGSTSQQASTAMYQLSQALAAGRVSLQDWNSVVNAGMGGEVFQNALKETSRALGTGVDEAIEKFGTFRESLTRGEWLTKDVLTTTLNAIGGAYDEAELKALGFDKAQTEAMLELAKTATEAATVVKTGTQLMDTLKEAAQSGWTQTWETIVGNFEESKEFWSYWSNLFGDIINKSADSRNAILKDWKTLGGRTELFESLKLIVGDIVKIIGALKQGFRDVFPRTTGMQLYKLTEGFHNFLRSISVTEKNLEGLRGIMRGVATVIKLVLIPFQLAIKLASLFVAPIINIGKALLDVVGKVGDLIFQVNKANGIFSSLDKVFKWIGDKLLWLSQVVVNFINKFAVDKIAIAVKWVGEAISNLIKKIKELWTNFWSGPPPDFTGFFNVLKTVLGGLVAAFNAVKNAAVGVWDKMKDWGVVKVFQKLYEWVVKVGKAIKDYIIEGFSRMANGDFSTLFELLAGAGAIGIGKGIHTLTKNFNGFLKSSKDFVDSLKGIKGVFSEMLDTIAEPIHAFTKKIKAETLFTIAKAIALLAASLFVLSLVDPIALGGATAALTTMFLNLSHAMNTLSGFDLTMKSTITTIGLLTAMGLSVLMLASAIKKIGDMDPAQLAMSMAAITILVYEMMYVVKTIDALSRSETEAKAMKGIGMIIAVVGSIRLLVGAVKSLGKMDAWSLVKGMAGVSLLILELTMMVEYLSRNEVRVDSALKNLLVMTSFAFAVSKIAKACARLAKLSGGELIKGLGGITVLLAELTAMIVFLGSESTDNQLSKASIMEKLTLMVSITAMITLVVMACKKLGNMPVWNIIKGISAFTVLVGVMVIAIQKLASLNAGQTELARKNAYSMTIVAAAMYITAMSIKKLGKMSLGDLAKGVVAFALSMKILCKAMNTTKLSPSAAASFVIMGTSLYIIGMAFKKFNKISIGSVVVGLIAFTGALVLLTFAAKKLAPYDAMLKSFAVTLLLFSAAALAVSIAAVTMATALTMVAGLTGAALTAAVVAIKAIIVAIIDMIPAIVAAVVDGIRVFINTAKGLITTFAEFFADLVKTFLSIVSDLAPSIVSTVMDLIMTVLNAVNSRISEIVDKIMSIVIKAIKGVADRMPELITAVLDLIMGIFDAVVDYIQSGNLSFDKLLAALTTMATMLLISAGFVVTGALAIAGLALAAVAVTEMIAVLALLGGISTIPGIGWLVDQGGALLKKVGDAIGGFIGSLVGGAVEGFATHLPGIGDNLAQFMEKISPFVNGIQAIDGKVLEGMKTLTETVLGLSAANFLDAVTSFITGGRDLAKFGETVAEFGTNLKDFSDNAKGVDLETVGIASKAIKTLAEASGEVPRSGGVLGWLMGDHDWSNFAENLDDFGMGLRDFNKYTKNINVDSVKAAATAFAAIADGTNKIPKKGGLLQALIGETPLNGFTTNLPALGEGMAEFGSAVSGKDIKVDKVQKAADAFAAICQGCNEIPSEGGLLQALIGGKDITKFIDQLGGENSIASGISSFAESLTCGDEGFNKALQGADVFASICSAVANIPDTGAWQAVFGGKDVEAFANNLPLIGKGIRGFAEAIGGSDFMFGLFGGNELNFDMITDAAKAFSKITSIVNKINDTDTSSIKQKLNDLGSNIRWFFMLYSTTPIPKGSAIDNLKEFMDTLKTSLEGILGLDTSGLTAIAENVNSLGAIGTGMDFSASIDAASAAGSAMVAAFNDVIGAAANVSNAQQAGEAMGSAFAKGLGGKVGEALAAGMAISMKAASGARTSYLGMYLAGAYVGQGFVNGIATKNSAASAAGGELGRLALAAAKAALKEKSPSRAMMEVGAYAGEGFVNGIADWYDRSSKAGQTMAQGTLKAVSDAIDRTAMIINSDKNLSPVITPVVDLSDVTAKASSISSLLGNNTVINGRLGNISGNFAAIQNGVTNADVVEAVDRLNDNLSNLNSNTYNINGITYDDGSNIATAVQTLTRAAIVGRRV